MASWKLVRRSSPLRRGDGVTGCRVSAATSENKHSPAGSFHENRVRARFWDLLPTVHIFVSDSVFELSLDDRQTEPFLQTSSPFQGSFAAKLESAKGRQNSRCRAIGCSGLSGLSLLPRPSGLQSQVSCKVLLRAGMCSRSRPRNRGVDRQCMRAC